MNRKFYSALFAPLIAAAGIIGSATARDLPEISYQQFASGFVSPLHMKSYREGDQAFLVVDQIGVIHFLGEEGGQPGEIFFDVRDRMVELREKFDERGLLGLAFHPKFDENGKLYVYYSAPLQEGAPEGFDHTSHLSEFTVNEDGNSVDMDSERILLKIDEPQFNHDGGNIVFGKDGYLYIAVGDGGKANDMGLGHVEGGNGQFLGNLLGKILRIDVDSGDPYGIPSDNPLVGKEGRDEIFAWGLRNPWGLTTDTGGEGALIAADVGQNRFEEIDVIKNGGNYGWPRYEGYAEFDQENPGEIVEAAEGTTPDPYVPPVLVYPHGATFGEAPGYGISVTGGHVYRGKTLPGLDGVYVFGDWAMSWGEPGFGLYAGVPESDEKWDFQVIPGDKSPDGPKKWITGFGQTKDGEIYVLTNDSNGPRGTSGAIWKIVPKG